jgi:short-subunit dehydrogenase
MGLKLPPPAHIAITGAGSGIGAALARHYARPGIRLSLLGRNTARLDAIAAQCRARGADVVLRGDDVTDADSMAAWLTACDDSLAVDLIIANAGIGGDQVLAGSTGETLATANRIVMTNVQGVMNSIVPLLPRLTARRKGAIVIIASLAGFIALGDSPVYCASKAAVRMYGLALCRLLAPHGVTVTVASPGFIDTPMSASLNKPLPFLWTAERAAGHIAAGVARGARDLAFPWQMALAVRLAALLPPRLVDKILKSVGA